MKRLMALFILLLMLLSLVGCVEPDKPSYSFINGVNLEEFAIVYSAEDNDYSKRAAEYIQTEILARTDIELPLVEDSAEAVSEYEIVVGNTERKISGQLNAETSGLEFAIMADDTSVALEGDYFIIAAAAYYFIETYVPVDNFDASVPKETCILEPIVKEARNYILLIGDGMGVYQTKIFDYMENGVEYGDGEDFFYGELLPYKGFSITRSLSGVTDSAAGGTALSCGIKTYNGYVGKDRNGNDSKSLTELAYELGMSAGVMSTENRTGATPATFSAHADSRSNNETILESQAKAMQEYGTVIDCGYDYYNTRYMKVIENHILDTVSKLEANENGFFLMYEEAHIDKHCHDNDLESTFEAVVRFNQAIARFMEYAFYNPNTFILITADHETGGLYPDENSALQYTTENHTSDDVPIFAYGDGAELFDGVEIENIQIAHTIASLMGEDNFGDQSVYKALTK
nr:alkaline phosphatase [Oscillospiraceae bacterium]